MSLEERPREPDCSRGPAQVPSLEPLVPATARGEATRKKLLTAAEGEFGSKGFHLASVSSITTRAGVGQGTFYLYFRTKEEIFVTLVREIGKDLIEMIVEAVAKIESTDRISRDRRAMEAFFQVTAENPGRYRIVQESQFVDESIFREYYESLAKAYSKDLELGVARGDLKPGDAQVRAWTLMGVAHFLGLRHCMWGGDVPPTTVMDAAFDLIVNGMVPRSA